VNLLEFIIQHYDFSPKHVVFQITNPTRKTLRYSHFGPDDLDDTAPNYVSGGSPDTVIAVTSGSCTEPWHTDMFLAQENDVITGTELRALLTYTRHLLSPFNNTVYSQINIGWLENMVDFTMEDHLGGREEYMKQVFDNGMHLNNTTLINQAHYINGLISLPKHVNINEISIDPLQGD
jgi:hypothetical protein